MQGDIPKINLEAAGTEQHRILARRRFYLADLATLTARDEMSGELSSVLPAGLSPKELAALASMLYDRLPAERKAPLDYHFGGARVAYQRQGYADSAYSLFSEMLDGATVLYTDSGRSAAEQVFSETADFCILPYADRDGSLVRSSRAIAEELGLLLTGTASVGLGESGALTYALYGRALLAPTAQVLLISLRVPYTGEDALSRLLAIAGEARASLVSVEGSRSSALLRASLSVEGGALDRLVFMLRLLLTDTDVVGLFPYDGDEL